MTDSKFYAYIYENGEELVPYGIGTTREEAMEDTKETIAQNGEAWELDAAFESKNGFIVCYKCTKAAYDHLKENNDGIAFVKTWNGLIVATEKEARMEYCGGYRYDPEEFSHDEVRLLKKVERGDASLSLAKEEREEHGIDLGLDDDDLVLCEYSTGRYYYLRIENEEITGIYEKEPAEA